MSDDTSDRDDTPPRTSPDTSDDGRSVDALVDALADRRTRYVVSALESRQENVVPLSDLVDDVAEREVQARASQDDSADHRKRVAIDLHHRSLPKLGDAAVLDYDPRSNTVRYWEDGRIPAYLELFGGDPNV